MKSSAFLLFLQHLRRDRKKYAELCSQLIVFMVFSRYSIFYHIERSEQYAYHT